MYGIDFRHEVTEDGGVSLAYYRYADDITGEVMCELIDGELVWYTEPPNESVLAIVTERASEIMRTWYLEYNGIKPSIPVPVTDFNTWAEGIAENEI